MLLEPLRRVTRDPITLIVAIEIAVVVGAAVGVFVVLANQYNSVVAALVEQTAVAQPTAPPAAVAANPSATPGAPSTPTAWFISPTIAVPSSTGVFSLSVTQSPSPKASVPSPGPRTVAPTRPIPSIAPATVGSPVSSSRTAPIVPVQPWRTLSGCGTVTTPGYYRLVVNLSTTGDCIKLQTSSALLDCDGHSIRGTGFGGTGISVMKFGILNATVPTTVEIRNCQISNFRFGIYVEAGTRVSLHDNTASDNYDDTDSRRYGNFLGMTEGGGIRVNAVSDSSITNNVTESQAIGIDVRYSNKVTVAGNTSSDNSAWGINLFGTGNSTVSGNTTADNVRRCTWGNGTVGEGCDSGGIVLQGGSSNNVVSNNIVSGRNGNGIFIKAHGQPCGNNNSILNNTITSVMYNSIELSFCAGNRIQGNTIRDGLDGIWLGYSQDTTIQSNTIQNMYNHGIISSNSRNNVVSSNQIINSNEAISFYSEPYDQTVFYWLPKDGDFTSHHNCLCSNLIQSNNIVGIRLKDSTNNQVTGNTFKWNGKTIIVQGNGQGNDLSGNTTLTRYRFVLPGSLIAVIGVTPNAALP